MGEGEDSIKMRLEEAFVVKSTDSKFIVQLYLGSFIQDLRFDFRWSDQVHKFLQCV